MADLIFVAVGIVSSPVALLQCPGLVRNDSVGWVDDQCVPTEHAETARVLLEDYGVCDATRRSIECPREIGMAVGPARNRPRLRGSGSFGTVDTCKPARASQLAGDRHRSRGEDHQRRQYPSHHFSSSKSLGHVWWMPSSSSIAVHS